MNINNSNYYIEVLDVIDWENGKQIKNYFKKNKIFNLFHFKEICEELAESQNAYYWAEDRKEKGYRVIFNDMSDVVMCEVYFKVFVIYDNEILTFFNE